MKSHHNIDLSTVLSSQKTLSTFIDKESQQQMYTELAAVDKDHSQERKESSPAGLFLTKLRTSLSD